MDARFDDQGAWAAPGQPGADRKPSDCAGERATRHGLRMRVAVGQPARSALASAGCSFDRRLARALAVYGKRRTKGLAGVNRSALGDSKCDDDNDAVVAGAYAVGD